MAHVFESKGFELGGTSTSWHVGERPALMYVCLLMISIEHRQSMPITLGGLQWAHQTSLRVERRWECACGRPGHEANGVRAAEDICECRTTL